MPDIITSQVFQDGEKGITATKMNNIVADSVIQPAFYSAKPASPTLDPADQLLELKANGAFARITGAQLISSLPSQSLWTPETDGLKPGLYNAIQIEDDFRFSPINLTASGYTGSGPLNWFYTAGIAGSGGVQSVNYGLDRFNKASGVWWLFSNVGSTGYANLLAAVGAGYSPAGTYSLFAPGMGALTLYCRVAFERIPAATPANVVYRIGLSDTFNSLSNNSLSLKYFFTSGAATWVLESFVGGAAFTPVSSTVPAIPPFSASGLSFAKIKCVINAAWTSASWYVNGVLVGTTTNIPTAWTGVVPYFQVGNGDATSNGAILADSMVLDYAVARP